jgi:hypothetical protein
MKDSEVADNTDQKYLERVQEILQAREGKLLDLQKQKDEINDKLRECGIKRILKTGSVSLIHSYAAYREQLRKKKTEVDRSITLVQEEVEQAQKRLQIVQEDLQKTNQQKAD